MRVLVLVLCIHLAGVAESEKDGWVWDDGRRRTGRMDEARYLVEESSEELDYPVAGFRPQNAGPYGPESRPISAAYQGNKEVLVGPGGPAGTPSKPWPHQPGHGGNFEGGISNSGFVPSWLREDPRYREYDTCRCRYSFNCPANALKFGACSREKKYCCFNSGKYPALAEPGYPGEAHRIPRPGSPHKYGPIGFAGSSGNRGGRRPLGNRNPAENFHPSREDLEDYRPDDRYDPYDRYHRYDRPGAFDSQYGIAAQGFDVYARSLSRNQTEAAKAEPGEKSR
ncbi:hypothetical protein KM043_007267 [Ampulex compressa]|nr:hypothetical protein KM043_007267 [Ampulex compressa]